MKNLQVPSEIVSQIVTRIRDEQKRDRSKVNDERRLLEARLVTIRNRMDKSYSDKLDGKIAEDFWERLMTEWRMAEQQVQMVIRGLNSGQIGDRALDAEKFFELANNAYLLYVSQNPFEKANLLAAPTSLPSQNCYASSRVDLHPSDCTSSALITASLMPAGIGSTFSSHLYGTLAAIAMTSAPRAGPMFRVADKPPETRTNRS